MKALKPSVPETHSYVLDANIGCRNVQRTVTVRVSSPVSKPEDTIGDFQLLQENDSQIQFSVAYNYNSSDLDPIYIGARAVGYGQILDHFAYTPFEIHPGSGKATITLGYGYLDPPEIMTSDEIEVYMYWSAQEYHKVRFYFPKTWKSRIVVK